VAGAKVVARLGWELKGRDLDETTKTCGKTKEISGKKQEDDGELPLN
jgi:hypothetical protein